MSQTDSKNPYRLRHNVKTRRWTTLTANIFRRLAGDSIVRLPYVRLAVNRSLLPIKSMVRLDGGRPRHFILRPGAITLVPPDAHSHSRLEEFDAIEVYHEPSVYRRVAADMGWQGAIDFDFIDDLGDPHIAELIAILAHEVEGVGLGDHLLIESLSNVLAILVLRRISGARLPEPHSGALPPERLRRVEAFIDAHLTDKELSVSDIAAVACLGAHQFGRSFKNSTGVTPYQFVLTRRIELTKSLLRSGRLPLSAVAHEAGFADQAHFTTRFRLAVGTTPRQYRQAVS